MHIPNVLIAITLGVVGVNGFFRMPCSQPLVVQRADPIVNPGAISGHVHTVMGGNGFNFTQTFESSRASTCSTCKAKKDASNYWIPSLYYQAQNGAFHPVSQNGGALIYYLQRYNSNSRELAPFPPGFQMLAGDPGLRSYDPNSLAQRAVSFVCLNYHGDSPQTPEIPNVNCPDGLRTQIFFPSCWDGVNLDSPNHKDHVAYPSNMDSGDCPASHPVRLVSLFYEVIWNVNEWKDMWWRPDGHHPFVFSMGDPTGYGFHGDFLNGWEPQALERAINECTTNSGVIEDCASIIELYSNEEMDDCRNPAQVDEVIDGWLDSLPGCNTVQFGPERATKGGECGKMTPAILSKNEVGFIRQDVPQWDGVGCAQDNLGARLLPNQFTDPAMTIEMCTNHCQSRGFSYAGLQWGIECWCGNNFDEGLANLSGSCIQPCAGNPSEYCGNGGILSVYKYNPNKIISSPPPPSPPATTTTTQAPKSTSTSVNGVTMSVVSPPLPPVTTTATTSTTSTVNSPTPTSTSTSTSMSTSTSTSSATTSSTVPNYHMPGKGAPDGWKYRGCYVDTLHPRSLAGTGMYFRVPMTPKACTDYCASKGFAIAGTEYSGECFCGNEFTSSAIRKPETECNMRCRGDQNIMCGGPARLSIYTNDTRQLKRDVDEMLERSIEDALERAPIEGEAEKRNINVSHIVRAPSSAYGDMHLALSAHRRALAAKAKRNSFDAGN